MAPTTGTGSTSPWAICIASAIRAPTGVTKPRPKVLFEPGEVVRVKDGPFVDFNGVVEDVDYEGNSVRVAVQILGRSTPVQLNFMQIEKT